MSSYHGDVHERGTGEDVEAEETTQITRAQSDEVEHEDGKTTGREIARTLADLEALDEDEDVLPSAADDNDAAHINGRGGDVYELEPDAVNDTDVQDLEIDAGPSTPLAHSPLASPADSGSIPDDLPSHKGSLLSTPIRDGSPASRKTPTRTVSGALQPFERRFEARSLASPSTSPRAASPAFLSSHSRQHSLSSQVSQISSQDGDAGTETPQAPWDVIRWTKLKKISSQAFSEAGKRNFGRPTCIAVSALIAIGTSKGLVLGFDYHQTLKIIVGPGTKATECGSVTALAIAADYSTIASGHANGYIFTWEISRPARPFLQIPPLDRNVLQQQQHEDGHAHNCAILHIAFLGTRHTALVSADAGGMAFSHIASRGLGPVTRTIQTTRLLGRYPSVDPQAMRSRKPSSVLAFSPLPLGNVEQPTDSMGLTALLTPYLLVIVSTTPVAQTQHKSPRPKELSPHSTLSGCLAWFPAVKLKSSSIDAGKGNSDTKLAYCWSNVVSVLDVKVTQNGKPEDPQRPPSLEFEQRSRWRAEEAVVAVQWLGRSVLGVLTISQRLLIVEDGSLRVTDSIDLLHKHIYHQDLFSEQLRTIVEQLNSADPSLHGVVADAFFMSFRAYKGRTFLLGFNDLSLGTLSNWADRLVALMEAGDHIAAIRLATDYYCGRASNVTIGLPESDSARHRMVKERLVAMITASANYTFSQHDEDRYARLRELAEVVFEACTSMQETEFLFSDVFEVFQESDEDSVFITTLEPYILDGEVRALPPEVIKALVAHFIFENQAARLEELLCRLDPLSFDLEQVTTLCRQHSLYDALIFAWTQAIGDYVTPLIDLLSVAKLILEGFRDDADITDNPFYESAAKVFPYLAYSWTGRRYPRGLFVDDNEADRAKADLYEYLFAGTPTAWPHGSDAVFHATDNTKDEPAFPYLDLLLRFDAASFMSMLNEAFEDSFLNVADEEEGASSIGLINGSNKPKAQIYKMTRQHVIEIMLDVMRQGDYGPEQVVFLDMFIARSLPKYPGQLILNGSLLNGALYRLCSPPSDIMKEDCQLSVEYLLSAYRPPNMSALIEALRNVKFYRVLKNVYRGERMYRELLESFFEDPEDKDGVFSCISSVLRPSAGLTKKQTQVIFQSIREHFRDLAAVDITRTALTLAGSAPDLLQACVDVLPETRSQYAFLRTLLEPEHDSARRDASPPISEERASAFVEQYVRLMCEHDPTHVADYIRALPSSDLQLDQVLPAMEACGVIDAAVLLLARDGLARDAMDRLVAHIYSLEHALLSLIETASSTPDAQMLQETATDLVEDIQKYTKVGVWLCQGQSASVERRPRPRTNMAWDINEDDLDLDEYLWLGLIDVTVQATQNTLSALKRNEDVPSQDISQDALDSHEIASSLRSNVQQVFTTVLASTSSSGPHHSKREASDQGPRQHHQADDMSFLRILRAFLTRAAKMASSLAELRAVLADVLSVYSFEQDVLSLANELLGSDLYLNMENAHNLRQRGWRPKTQVCEQCKRRAWGTGIGEAVWNEWVNREQEREADKARKMLERCGGEMARRLERGKAKAAATEVTVAEEGGEEPGDLRKFTLVVFACRHTFHRVCLDEDYKDGKPPRREKYQCPLCTAPNS